MLGVLLVMSVILHVLQWRSIVKERAYNGLLISDRRHLQKKYDELQAAFNEKLEARAKAAVRQ